jgi:O-antigen/teichoic acid export membrane protein
MTTEAAQPPQPRPLIGGVVWNLLGRGLPLAVALLLTPILVHQLGLERWGLFTLALAMVGVFSIFDFGVGLALTRALAERMGSGRMQDAPQLVAAAILALFCLSSVGAAGLWLGVPLLVERALNVPEALQPQAVEGLRVLVLAVPLVVLNAALWGVLAAWQKFRAANLVTIPVSILYYLGPVLALMLWDSLTAVMLTLVACRLANTVSYALLARPLLPGFSLRGVKLAMVLPLLRLGGWMTFSNTLSQLLLYADRFLIGAMLSLAAVAWYATPLDLVLRMWVLPVAVAQTLLPALAASFTTMPERAAALLQRGALMITALVFPACLVLVAGAELLLRLWLGAEFAAGSGTVLRILGIGILFSCFGFAPGALIDAIGRPDLTARLGLALAVVFLPIAVAVLWLGYGIEGAALVWTARAAAEALGKLALAARFFPPARAAALQVLVPLGVAAASLGAVAALHGWLLGELGSAVAALLVFALVTWRAMPAPDRAELLRRLGPRPAGGAA